MASASCFRVVFSCRVFRHIFLLILDLPVNQESQYRAEYNDSPEYAKLRPFADDYRTENLTAHLEFLGKRYALREVETDILAVTPYPSNDARTADVTRTAMPKNSRRLVHTSTMLYIYVSSSVRNISMTVFS